MGERGENCVQYQVQMFAEVLRKKPEDEVSMALQELVLSTITAIRLGIGEMLRTVQFDNKSSFSTEKVHLHLT